MSNTRLSPMQKVELILKRREIYELIEKEEVKIVQYEEFLCQYENSNHKQSENPCHLQLKLMERLRRIEHLLGIRERNSSFKTFTNIPSTPHCSSLPAHLQSVHKILLRNHKLLFEAFTEIDELLLRDEELCEKESARSAENTALTETPVTNNDVSS
jgi:kynurenine formamidase